jgi:hypothetical protein
LPDRNFLQSAWPLNAAQCRESKSGHRRL